MVDPGLALFVFALVVVATALVVWPRQGLAPRLIRLWRMTERVRIEDALKHLYNAELARQPGTASSLAGALQVSAARAVKVMARLETLGFAQSVADGLRLTEDGRAYALRILRTHRLWERYLADRTGMDPVDWHDDAEVKEHHLSAEQTEELASRMGQPLYDPHGDPIPTATGELPAVPGIPLTALEPGLTATIVHLEDEPREVFDRVLAEGLAPGMPIEVVSVEASGIRFKTDGREHELLPVVAANVTVVPKPTLEVAAAPQRNLADLETGERGTVIGISPACQGAQRRRLLDLGVVPGTEIEAEMVSAAGDPVAYRIRGAMIALRGHQAEWILIEPSAVATGQDNGHH
jgi:DtxR family Mn-dependent transcriptional regulator